MDLLDRYLQAVKFWLPKAQKQDMIAELSEDLRSQIEDRESALGRPLTKSEVGDILRHVGRPMLVANRYLPQRYLIGPLWFPIYAFVLKVVAACYLVPWVVVWVGLMIFDPSYRAAHGGADWLDVAATAWGGLWAAAMLAVFIVTLLFAVLERVHAKSAFLEQWDPAKLPAVRDVTRIPRGTSTLELVTNVVFCSWWVTAMWSPVVLDRPGVRIVLSPAWRMVFVGFLLLALVNIIVAAVNLVRPYWTARRAFVRLVTNFCGAALFYEVCRAGLLAQIDITGVASARAIEIVGAINRVLSQVWPAVVALGLVMLIVDIYRITRARNPNRNSPLGVAGRGVPTSQKR